MLHRLRNHLGVSVRVCETGAGVGGTWYWNRHPGALPDAKTARLIPCSLVGIRKSRRGDLSMDVAATMLFKNANLVLDGHAELQRSYDVLVRGDRIVAVSSTPLTDHDAKVVDVGGRTLMPGLI